MTCCFDGHHMATKVVTSSPTISVALCSFNGETFIASQIESILQQSRPVDEIVICDDGSADGTLAILESLAHSSRIPIRLQRNPQRLGVTGNFAKAISLTTGDVIFLCDQDDVWHTDKVARIMEALANPAVAMAFSNAQVVDAQLQPAGYHLWDSIWFNPAEQKRMAAGDAAPVLLRHAVAAGSTLAFKREYLPLILPMPDLPHSHDIWITLMLACVARIQPINEDLIRYRLHENNAVGMKWFNLIGQYHMARRQITSGTFANLATLHQAARDRLQGQNRWPVSAQILRQLQEKVRHNTIRHEMHQSRRARLPAIGRELYAGNYRRYSYGFKSVLQDLFM